MSWDVMLFNTRGKQPPPIEQFEESHYEPLGPAAGVRQRLTRLLPKIDWSDTSWGIYEGDGFSIEFNAGGGDPIDTIMLHVRGGGDAIAAIVSFAPPEMVCARLFNRRLPGPRESIPGWVGRISSISRQSR